MKIHDLRLVVSLRLLVLVRYVVLVVDDVDLAILRHCHLAFGHHVSNDFGSTLVLRVLLRDLLDLLLELPDVVRLLLESVLLVVLVDLLELLKVVLLLHLCLRSSPLRARFQKVGSNTLGGYTFIRCQMGVQ